MDSKNLGKGLDLRVNSQKVEQMMKLGDQCHILVPEGGGRYFTADNNGEYRLEVRVKPTSKEFASYFRVSSVIVI